MIITQLLVNFWVTAGHLEGTGNFEFSNWFVKSRLKEKQRRTAGISKLKLKNIAYKINVFTSWNKLTYSYTYDTLA